MVDQVNNESIPLVSTVLSAWQTVVQNVGRGETNPFSGRAKEKDMVRELRRKIEQTTPDTNIVGPDFQESSHGCRIDLVVAQGDDRIAVEAKYKTDRDGAVPDNRKAAFLDLYRLELYVKSGEYSAGVFLWLTENRSYLTQAKGDSADFSTHSGRRYVAGTPLRASRARNKMPLPLVLSGNYKFHWKRVGRGWHSLAIPVLPFANSPP